MVYKFLVALALIFAPVPGSATAAADSSAALSTPTFAVSTKAGNRLLIFSELAPLAINRMHRWRLRLSDASGAPIGNARITLRGGMPDHDHGLPTRPEASATDGPGEYLLQGIRFHMPGRWLLEFSIAVEDAADSAAIEFEL